MSKLQWPPFAGLYLGQQSVRFVILFAGRAGSTYLVKLLNSHDCILALGEELATLRDQGAEVQLNWTNDFLSAPPITRYKARGFKAKLVDIVDPPKFASLLHKHRCKVIHLTRRNQVKAVISRINALRLFERTGEWNLFDEKDRLPPLSVDLTTFQEFLDHRVQVDASLRVFVSELSLPTLAVSYEDLLTDRHTMLLQVFEFLGVPLVDVAAGTLKNTSDDLRQVIVNFDELRSGYSGTEYEEMFDEVLAVTPNSSSDPG